MEKLDKILKSYVAVGDDTKDKLLGAAFVVTNKDGPIYSGGAGRIDFAHDSPKYTPDSFQWMASMSKLVTAVAALQLVEKGLWKLDDDVRPLLPELASIQILKGFDDEDKPILEDNTRPITLRQLLSHTSGLCYDAFEPTMQKYSAAVGRTANNFTLTRAGFTCPLKYPPGDSWTYASGLDWTGFALQQLTGQTLGAHLAAHVFAPLAMADTTFHPTAPATASRTAGRAVASLARDGETGLLGPAPLPVTREPEVESGGAGLWGTAADYARLLRALLAGGGPVLSRESVELLFAPQLSEGQRAAFQETAAVVFASTTPAQFDKATRFDYGLGGAVNLTAVEGKAGKGSLTWGGALGTVWWIDREADVAGVTMLSAWPIGDMAPVKLLDELQRAVYADLLPSLKS